MSNSTNIILSVIFGGLSVWMLKGLVRSRGRLKYKDRMWNASRILFLICGLLLMLSVLVYTTVLDFVRMALMILCVLLFLMERDGMGEEGVFSQGSLIPWDKIRAWDYEDKGRKFRVYFVFKTVDRKGRSGDTMISVDFDIRQKEQVKAYLKEKAGKKYTRMRKNG